MYDFSQTPAACSSQSTYGAPKIDSLAMVGATGRHNNGFVAKEVDIMEPYSGGMS